MEPMEAVLWALITALALALLLDLAVLVRRPGKWRKRMGAFLCPLAVVLTLLVPGSYGLGRLGLAWRSGVLLGLCLLLAACLAGLVAGAAWYLAGQLEGREELRCGVVVAGIGLCASVFLTAAFYGTLFTAFAVGDERVVTWEGRQVVEADLSWLDPDYAYYDYHGPLVRGNTPLARSDKPLT